MGFLNRFLIPPSWAIKQLPIDETQDLETEYQEHLPDRFEPEDISGQTFGIEYVSSKGIKSQREISVHKTEVRNGNIILVAHCFARERVRTFRVDRITAVYDVDGIVEDPVEFFLKFGINVESEAAPEPRPAAMLKDRMKYEAIILVALARTDGRFAHSEMREILVYCVKKLENMGHIQNEEDIAEFEYYLSNLYPTNEVVYSSIGKIKSYTGRGKREFLHNCQNIINADKIQQDTEVDMILDLKYELFEGSGESFLN